MLLYISHIKWYGHSNGHKSHDTWKDVEGSERIMSYNMYNMYWSYGIHMVI